MAKSKVNLRTSLMTGVSYMIPFVTAGGILIALSFAIGGYEGFKETGSLAEYLFNIGGTAFGLMVPVLAGFIAFAIADRPGIAPGMVAGMLASTIGAGFLGGIIGGLLAGYLALWIKNWPVPKALAKLMPVLIIPLLCSGIVGLLMVIVIGTPIKSLMDGLSAWLRGLSTGSYVILGIVLGLMMAFDMGGPVNKVAYTFGLAMISENILEPHAAIMAAGMTPPLGLALATLLAPHKYSKREIEAGKAAWIMGASFITEGAIPFAAADPLRVIPSIMIGSATAGALSMLFKCTLRAPHGGIFVIPMIGNFGLYLLALAAGTVVTALLVNFLKQTIADNKDTTESSKGVAF
ncbi:MAG TPA: PTS fructose transporter subunit IIBC [Firmicutes bacterium]|jgi:PTS system fructose-specific IIC component|nr:PTS fructose transporter subunit IIBC [Bacillota bacterium]